MAAKEFGRALIPSGIDPQLRWRLAVSLTLVSVLVWIAWAMGAFAGVGFPGLARAADVEGLKQDVQGVKAEARDIRAQQIAERIDAVSATLCMESYDAQLIDYRRELQRQHREVTGHEHTSPPCEILLKLRR